MSLTFGDFSILSLIMAFGGGFFGACIGAVQGFSLLGIVGIAAIAQNGQGVSFLMDTAFGFWLHPCTWFIGYCCAASYADKKGITDGMNITTPLVKFNDIKTLCIGGFMGMAGYSVFYVASAILHINADLGAVSVCTCVLLFKILKEKSIFNDTPADIKDKGGRYSFEHQKHWIPYLYDGPSKLLFGFAFSAVAVAATYAVGQVYGATEDLSIWASHSPAFIVFFISAASLIFVTIGFDIPSTHHITLSAGYAFCSSAATGCGYEIAFVWAIATGLFAAFFADVVADNITLYGRTWIDPPAATHLAVSLVVFNLPVTVLSNMIYPIILILLIIVIGLTICNPQFKKQMVKD